jgi:hypothetical protein
MSRLFLLLFCTIFAASVATAQKKGTAGEVRQTVYFIGEDEAEYEKLVQKYNTMLFEVCNNNMELAYDNWAIMMKDLEDYSNKQNIDLKGVKLWFNVFWDKDGTIDFIAFYPKPNSKNMNYELVKTMLEGFVSTYQSTLKHSARFSHYGSVAFPVFSRSVIGPEK